jgi:hypothetical protein
MRYEYQQNDEEKKHENGIWLFILALVVFGLLISMISGCATTAPEIDWNKVIAAIQEYKDDIPWDKLEDALNKTNK